MPFSYRFKPAHKEIRRYYDELGGYATHEVAHEGATSSAFQNLLAATCKKADWHLVPQLASKIRGKNVRPDGTLRDEFYLHHGYWEAKDSSDKLDHKPCVGFVFPRTNLAERRLITQVPIQTIRALDVHSEIDHSTLGYQANLKIRR